jgi:hypothetical protein
MSIQRYVAELERSRNKGSGVGKGTVSRIYSGRTQNGKNERRKAKRDI